MGSKSGNNMRLFFPENPVWRTYGSRSNPGVLRGFPEGKNSNQSPIRAYFPNGKLPIQAQNRNGFEGYPGVDRYDPMHHPDRSCTGKIKNHRHREQLQQTR
jgi:hypothetical protein